MQILVLLPLIALVAWMVTASHWTIGQVVMIWLLTFVVGVGGFAHCIVTSCEILASAMAGPVSADREVEKPEKGLVRAVGRRCAAIFDVVDLIVRAVDDERVTQVGVVLEPIALPLEWLHLTPPFRDALTAEAERVLAAWRAARAISSWSARWRR